MSDSENKNTDDCIFSLTRIPAEGFDAFIGDPELVIATVEDLGFDLNEMMASVSQPQADPATLYQLMEGRWSGEQPTFSLEKTHHLLCYLLTGNTEFSQSSSHPVAPIFNGGRNSQIYNEHGAIRVLTPSQVEAISEALEATDLAELQQRANVDALNKAQLLPHKNLWSTEQLEDLWTLYPALQTFFDLASNEDEFVLLTLI